MPVLTVVDLFSGLGGASAAMADRGWKVLRLDIESRFHPTVVADVLHLPLREGLCPDLLWMSPPCTEFTRWMFSFRFGSSIPSMDLVDATRSCVCWLRPRWWVLENVRGSVPFLGTYRQRFGPFYLWGEFPLLMLAGGRPRKDTRHVKSPEKRALVPYDLSLALALAIEHAT
jgi:hypothetical protein